METLENITKTKAWEFALAAHGNQKYGAYPYSFHLKQVVEVAEKMGFDEDIILGCILHDTIEDTEVMYSDIKSGFGVVVSQIVLAVTDEPGDTRKEKKAKTYPKTKANWKATAVKLCDRIANVGQSKMDNPKSFEKYKSEHIGFVENIKCKDHPKALDKAWKVLDDLFNK